MRTTVTLDPDVSVLLDQLRETRGLRFKEAVNLALREGLASLAKQPKAPVRSFTMDWECERIVDNVDNVAELLAQ